MLAVLAGAFDLEPDHAFEERERVVVVRPADLSVRGWSWEAHAPGRACLVLPGHGEVPASALDGVLTRLHRVTPRDLGHMDAEDREYVADEMTAFLAALLATLPVPVINAPSAASLCGPAWTHHHWMRAADAAGLTVCPHPAAGEHDQVAVLDGAVVGGADGTSTAPRAEAARTLQGVAGVRLLSVGFCHCHPDGVTGASPLPALTPAVGEAILTRFAAG